MQKAIKLVLSLAMVLGVSSLAFADSKAAEVKKEDTKVEKKVDAAKKDMKDAKGAMDESAKTGTEGEVKTGY